MKMKNMTKAIFRTILALLIIAGACSPGVAQAATDIYTVSTTWTAPAGVTSVDVEVWGGGGAGGGQNSTSDGGGGGGGGAYSKVIGVAVTPGNTYTVTVGAGGAGVSGGTGGSGGDSYFINVTTVLAKGGTGGARSTGTPPAGGAGGAAAAGVGTTTFSGGDGGRGRNNNTGQGGPGGSSAGTAAIGTSGPDPWSTVTAAAAPAGGGIGGNGGNSGNNGSAPASGNGGGGGGSGDGTKTGGNGAGGKVILTYIPPPTVTSINTASTNPTAPATAVAWTVVFSTSVTGVDMTDFVLVQAGGVTGASITSVTGSGTTWTVNANTGSGTGTLGLNLVDDDSIVGGGLKLGGTGAGNGDFTGQVYTVPAPFCSPPSNIPAGVTVTCQCDTFGRAALNPSTIFGGNWVATTSDATGIVPRIVNSGYLRLTENTGNNAKAATVPGIFPAAGNYISVEFKHYAYNGSGADGIAVTLSDYAVPAQPGAFGGSLGYANQTSINGFAGGWIGVALDEYGNYQNPTEGRHGGPGFIVQSVGVRGSGSGLIGYPWLKGTVNLTTVAPNVGIDNRASATPSLGDFYQVIVDSRGNNGVSGPALVSVNRDITGVGNAYSPLIAAFDAYAAATAVGYTQAPVPQNWQVSFTGSTGGSTNIHEIGALRICAQTMVPTTGGTPGGFNAIDEAYTRSDVNAVSGHLYTKLAGTAFTMKVAALNTTGSGILATYAILGNKTVTVKLIDDSVGTSCNASAAACSACSKPVVASQTMTFASTDTGFKQSGNFTVPAYANLIVQMSDGTTTGCSVDTFAVRPLGIASVISSNATNTTTSGTPIFKAGSDNFSLTATTTILGSPSGYTGGVPKINANAVQAASPATVAGVLAGSFLAATSGASQATSTGSTFTYSEVGKFNLLGPDFTLTPTRIPGVYDDIWTTIDSGAKGDCVSGTTAASYSNTKDANGKYGCNFGISANTGAFGRFVPDHFAVTATLIVNRADFGITGSIAAGAGALTLASAAGVKVGDAISIAGAGVAGATFSTTAAAVSVNGLTVTLASNAVTTVANSPVNVVAFTYMGEPMNALSTLTAKSAGNATTQNYTGTLAKLNPLAAVTAGTSGPLGFGLVNSAATRTPFAVCTATPADPCFTPFVATVGSFTSGVAAGVTVPLTVYRGASAVAPYAALDIGIAPVDSDGVTTAYDLDTVNVVAGASNHTRVGSSEVRYGRMKLSNAHGSELLQLPIAVTVQYWNGLNYVTSITDSVTILNATTVTSANWTNLTPGNWQKLFAASTWAAGATSVVPATASVVFVNGVSSFKLAAPGAGKTGSVDMTTSAPSYLPSSPARATFGVYKGANEFIYLRENY